MSLRGAVEDRHRTVELKLVILCPHDKEQAIQKALVRYAGTYWANGYIQLLSIPKKHSRDRTWITSKLANIFSRRQSIKYLIKYKGTSFDESILEGKAFIYETPSAKKLEEDILPEVLKSLQLDWLSFIEATIAGRWRHGTLDRQHIERWLEQWKGLDNNQWVAERILKALDFWSDDRMRNTLRITAGGVSEFDCISINRFLAGKSADTLSNLIQKQLEATRLVKTFGRVMDFGEAIDSDNVNRILFIEDCLLTGNEMVRVLMALQGQEDIYGKARAAKLSHPQRLREKKISLRFSVASNAGLAYLSQYLKAQNLDGNITVDYDFTGALQTLTPEGLDALRADCLIDADGCLYNPDLHVARAVFDPSRWRTKESRDRAMALCAQIGVQLYDLYLKKEQKEWSQKRINESGLGVRSYALALAFQHSVPKETLPLLWFNGTVKWRDQFIEWLALFENAA
jgi:hypothetical protein